MERLKYITLKDICDLIPGFAFKSNDFGCSNNRVIKIGDIQPPYVKEDGLTSVDVSSYSTSKLEKFIVGYDDFVLAMTGATIGKIGRYIGETPAYINQRVLLFKPKDGVNRKYVYYCLMSPIFQKYIDNHIDSQTAQPNISANSVSGYEIPLPDLDTQNRIASILSAIDDKIELNNRINHNLEQQAQALYKSWFVDFEPFKDGEFIKSGLRMIPKGWAIGTMGELLDIKYGKDHKKLADGGIPVYGSGGLMRYVNQAIHTGESVLIPRKGSLNNVIYVNDAFWTVDTMFFSIPKKFHVAKYCYQILSSMDLSSMNAGSAVPSMTTDILNSIKVVIPEEQVLLKYDTIISSLYQSIHANEKESIELRVTRDSLLPKLMSGDLNINKIDC